MWEKISSLQSQQYQCWKEGRIQLQAFSRSQDYVLVSEMKWWLYVLEPVWWERRHISKDSNDLDKALYAYGVGGIKSGHWCLNAALKAKSQTTCEAKCTALADFTQIKGLVPLQLSSSYSSHTHPQTNKEVSGLDLSAHLISVWSFLLRKILAKEINLTGLIHLTWSHFRSSSPVCWACDCQPCLIAIDPVPLKWIQHCSGKLQISFAFISLLETVERGEGMRR